MKKYIEQKGITYELRGEQYYPLLELPEQKAIGKYGRLHLEYLKEHRKGRYTNLLPLNYTRKWSGKQDSNLRHLGPKPSALPS